ncbi:zinc ribbon domain-containing protein [Halorussus halophilus]|uniref:zinc ribbon domain-containing protein n=1 Tax=Halorussus halophilus TaxID=2650975 RepID=UPI00130196B1|nr:zinc ribbon domain-containing protein [Halorussus halophilus]
MSSDHPDDSFGCEKCGHQSASTDEISTTGSGLSKMFDIQTKKFTVVSCDNCGYSELYRDVGNRGSDVVDVFFG